MLRLIIDFTQEESYLALNPTLQLRRKLDFDLHILPYPINGIGEEWNRIESRVATAHHRARERYYAMNFARYAVVQGLPELCRRVVSNPTVAHAGLCAANSVSFNHGIEFATTIFFKHWHESLDLNSLSEINSVLTESNVEPITRDYVLNAVRECKFTMAEEGVFTAPSYLINGHQFHGRQHLPVIRELLSK